MREGIGNVNEVNIKLSVKVTSSPDGNKSFYLLKVPFEPSHILLKLSNGILSPHLMGLLKRNAPIMRSISFISHIGVSNESLAQDKGTIEGGGDHERVIVSFGVE